MRRAGLVLAFVAAFGGARYASLSEPVPVLDPTSHAWQDRRSAIARAGVFLDASGERGSRPSLPVDRLVCTFVPKPIRGTTPKFDCRLPSGEVVKVKYGDNPEVPAEIAATRLLWSLGFAADHVSRVERVECVGCPPHPFRTRQLAEMLFLTGPFERLAGGGGLRVFEQVAVERKFQAPAIEPGGVRGWDWADLDIVDSTQGGASRAELDALRLVAVLLAHWDNKASNQRLVCLDPPSDETDEDEISGAACRRPLLMLQDLGATFGPRKVDFENWSRAPVWESDRGCVVTMETLPYHGATFKRVAVSEAGRLLLAARLSRFSIEDLYALFQDAGFPEVDPGDGRPGGVTPWVAALRHKIREVLDHEPCGSGT